MKILHVCTDDKFIDGMIDLFEFVYPNQNRFLIFGSKKRPLRYVKNKNIIMGDTRYLYLGGMRQDIKNIDVIIIHYLTEISAYLALQASPDVKIIWSGWGADYYRLMPEFNYKSVLPETRCLIENDEHKPLPSISFKSKIISLVNRVKIQGSIVKIIKRIDYFSSPVPLEYYIVKDNIPEFSAKYLQLNYSSTKTNLKNSRTNVNAKNILVGNSATPTNNHIEVFKLLKNIIPEDVKILVPLSYGNEAYREKIIKIGYEMFADQFQPLVGFLPLDDYQKKLADCSVVIMNHIRQQGRGNVLMSLYAGKKVFLRKESVVYQHLTSLGVNLFNIDMLNSKELNIKLDEVEVLNNQAIIEKNWSDEVVINNVKKIQDLILDYDNGN